MKKKDVYPLKRRVEKFSIDCSPLTGRFDMEVQISARHCTISDTLQASLKDEVDALGKFYPNITAASIVLDRESDLVRHCEITLNVKGSVVVASATEENMGKAIDSALERAKVQLKKTNEKQKAHQAESVANVTASQN